MAEQEIRTELNRLYWESEASVADIADSLDISRRALYDGIEPKPAGAPCPECGGALGYRNRTAAENLEAECPECGLEVRLEEGEPPLAPPEMEAEKRAAPLSATRRVPQTESGPVLGLLLLAGLAVGAAVAYILRRG